MRRLILFAFCLGCLSLTGSWRAGAQAEPQQSIDQALQFARAHRYSEAAAAIHKVAPPEDRQQRIAFFRLRASIESGLGHSEAAAEDIEAAYKLEPENVDLELAAKLARLAALAEAGRNTTSTLAELRSIALPPPRKLDVHLHTAEILSKANLYREAAEDLEQASHIAPDRTDIYFNLALARFRDEEFDAALTSAERAKSLEDSGSLESLLGDIEERRGDALAAAHNYQTAIALEPNVEGHRLALATELLKHQTFDSAIIVLEQARDIFPQSVRVKVLLGIAYYLVDRSTDSIRILIEAVKLDTTDSLAVRYLGEITLQDTAAPDTAAVKQICAFADAQAANRARQRQGEGNGTANALCGGVLLRLAEESGDASRKQEILHRLEEAVETAPDEPLCRCQLGKALEWSRQWLAARKQLEKCVRLDPNSPEVHYRLARVYRHLGLRELASEQTSLQERVAELQSEQSTRRINSVSRFLVLLNH